MNQYLKDVLPFVAARTSIPLADLYDMSAKTVMSFFGEHAMQLLAEIARHPDHVNTLSVAETLAWPAIKEAAALVANAR